MAGLFARPAALSSGLLARKGQARPAMRSQNLVGFSTGAAALDDLGWNDMGAPAAVTELTSVVEMAPVSEPATVAEAPVEVPQVLVEREVLRQAIVEAPEPEVDPITGDGGGEGRSKAAFTLRLDAERHLRLRLASASANRSAQALVTAALDALLATMPEVEALAERLPEPTPKRKIRA